MRESWGTRMELFHRTCLWSVCGRGQFVVCGGHGLPTPIHFPRPYFGGKWWQGCVPCFFQMLEHLWPKKCLRNRFGFICSFSQRHTFLLHFICLDAWTPRSSPGTGLPRSSPVPEAGEPLRSPRNRYPSRVTVTVTSPL